MVGSPDVNQGQVGCIALQSFWLHYWGGELFNRFCRQTTLILKTSFICFRQLDLSFTAMPPSTSAAAFLFRPAFLFIIFFSVPSAFFFSFWSCTFIDSSSSGVECPLATNARRGPSFKLHGATVSTPLCCNVHGHKMKKVQPPRWSIKHLPLGFRPQI